MLKLNKRLGLFEHQDNKIYWTGHQVFNLFLFSDQFDYFMLALIFSIRVALIKILEV